MKKTNILNRNRVDSALSAIYEYPLTILEAPMGFGKTTSVKNFIETEEIAPIWITYRNSENSIATFWNGFVDGIRRFDEHIGDTLKAHGFPADVPQMERFLLILNDIEFRKEIILVMDDYQLAHNMQLNKLILQLAEEEIDRLHILLITRDTSDINFVELLSKGLCHIISQQQLKFTEDETRDYCRMMSDSISETELKKICEYTDGWISFIYIILLGLKKGIPVGMSTTMEELIEKALFNSYDQQIKEFLLQLSIMYDFTAKQAKYVTKNEQTAVLLKKLNRENAFIFYDEKNRIYKIHNVLLDFLRFKQDFSAEQLGELYGRLGDWFLEKRDFWIAYGYLYRAGQTERILSYLNNPRNVRNRLTHFEGSDEMFDNAPRELLFKYPFAYLQHIFLSLTKGKKNAILGWTDRLDELEQHYSKMDSIDESYRNRIMGEILIVRKFTFFNHYDKIKASNDEIVKLLNGQNSYITLQNNIFTFGSPHLLYIYFRDAGTLKALTNMLGDNIGYAQYSNGCGTGGDSLSLAEYALETGDFDHVEINSKRAIIKAESKAQTSVILCAKFNLMRYHILEGKIPQAFDLLEQLKYDIDKESNPIFNTTVDLCRGYIFACVCQPEKIPSWLQTGDMGSADFFYEGIAFNYLIYGKAVMVSKRYEELEVLTEQFKKYFSEFSNQLGFIHNNIFKAVAKYNLHGIGAGIAVLEVALVEAQADQLIMPFVENAPHIMEMMKVISTSSPENEYFKRIHTLCFKYMQNIKGLTYRSIPLSQREIDVLSMAAEGLSRREIAARLCISEETIKTHLKNIYQKLEVNGKVSAIKIAKTRGYIGFN